MQLLQMYLSELDRDAHELMQLVSLAASSGRRDDDVDAWPDDAGSDDVTGEFMRHIAVRLRRKSMLAGRTLDRFLVQTGDRSLLGDGDGVPDHTPVNFTGSQTGTCLDAMRDLSSRLSNIAHFLTNVIAPRLLTTTTAPNITPKPTQLSRLPLVLPIPHPAAHYHHCPYHYLYPY